MTAKSKKKAKALIEMYQYSGIYVGDIRMSEESAIECALICVDEMLKQPQISDKQLNHLIEVKQETNKL